MTAARTAGRGRRGMSTHLSAEVAPVETLPALIDRAAAALSGARKTAGRRRTHDALSGAVRP